MKKTVKGFVDSEGNEYQYKDEIARSQNQNLEEEINSNKTYMDKVKTELKNDNKTLNGRIDTILTGTVNTTKLVTVHSATIRNNGASDLTFKISSKDNETLKSIKDKSPTVINTNVIAKALDGVAINGKGIPSSYNVESTNDEYVITVYSGSSSVVGQYVFMAVVTIAYEDIATDISSAELKDVRAGADGTVYKSAGEAVRQQIGSLKESVDGIGYNMNLFDDTKIETNKAYITKEGNKISKIDSSLNSLLNIVYRVKAGDVIYVERWWSFTFIFTNSDDKIITSMSGEPLEFTVPDNSDITKMYINVSNVAIERGIMFNINHALPDKSVTYNTFSVPSYETKKINEDIGKINEDIGKKEDYYYFYNNIIPTKTRYIAHRGYNYSAPENSIPAFKKAGELGAWGIETDLQNTSDGQIVIMHDNTVDNMTNGTGNVINMTFDEIRNLKIDTGNNVGDYIDSELVVPTLEEYLQICKKYGCVAIIELKRFSDENHVDTVVSKIVEMGMTHSCIVISFNTLWIEKVRKLNEQIHTSVLLDSFSDSDIEKYKNYKNFTLSVPHASLTEDLAKMTHKYNLLINTYTIYNNNLTDALIDKGCDFITINTDKVN